MPPISTLRHALAISHSRNTFHHIARSLVANIEIRGKGGATSRFAFAIYLPPTVNKWASPCDSRDDSGDSCSSAGMVSSGKRNGRPVTKAQDLRSHSSLGHCFRRPLECLSAVQLPYWRSIGDLLAIYWRSYWRSIGDPIFCEDLHISYQKRKI